MKQVASLQYGVIFKKAFSQIDVFKAFVKDIIGIELEIDKVETEKSFTQKIGNIKVEFDLYAEDLKNRVIVEGVNIIKRHTKPSQSNPQGGVVQKEAPINVSNVMLKDPKSGEKTRVGYSRTKDAVSGKKKVMRIAQKSGDAF